MTIFNQCEGCTHACDFIFSYYAADKDVLEDHEIQGLANEVSSEGLGSNGGLGKVLILSKLLSLRYSIGPEED